MKRMMRRCRGCGRRPRIDLSPSAVGHNRWVATIQCPSFGDQCFARAELVCAEERSQRRAIEVAKDAWRKLPFQNRCLD